MKKCKSFVNVHCSFDCPNAACEAFEQRFDIPCEDAGFSRIKCKDCVYYDKRCTCDDCFFQHSPECPNYDRP